LFAQELSDKNSRRNIGMQIVANKYTAETAMILNGANSFLYQLSLGPLYVLIALQKMAACTYGSVFAIVSPRGYGITLGDSQFENASGAVAGVCLSTYFERSSQDPISSGSSKQMGSAAAGILTAQGETATSAFNKLQSDEYVSKFTALLTYQQLGPMLHLLDAGITWAIGLVTGLQDMVQNIDSDRCSVIDYYIHNMTTCACGDDPVSIPAERKTDGTYAHWCKGTLKMIDGFGNVNYIYNPYTYQELFDKVEGMSQYLECLSRKSQDGTYGDVRCEDIEPRDLIFTNQGVSPISVFMRCKVTVNHTHPLN
jgi:hypothetical protein